MGYSCNITNVIDDDEESLSNAQEMLLSILPLVTGILSLLGSSNIVYHILKSTRHKKTPYGRIMLGLSLSDIETSTSLMLAPFLVPKESSSRVWGIGNTTTCNFQGFLTQMGVSAPCYNGLLSLYYLITIRFGVKRQVFAKRYEPYMHVCVIAFFLCTASAGASVKMYSEADVGMGCWISDYPEGCTPCGDCYGHYFGWGFTAVPSLLAFILLPSANISIFCHVRKTLKMNERYELDESTLQHRRGTQMKHITEVATQCTLYVVSFYISYTTKAIERIAESLGMTEVQIYPIVVLAAVLSPLQGFFNVIIFLRPNYSALYRALPGKSTMWLLKHVLREPDIADFASSYIATMSHNDRMTPGVKIMAIEEPRENCAEADDEGTDKVASFVSENTSSAGMVVKQRESGKQLSPFARDLEALQNANAKYMDRIRQRLQEYRDVNQQGEKNQMEAK